MNKIIARTTSDSDEKLQVVKKNSDRKIYEKDCNQIHQKLVEKLENRARKKKDKERVTLIEKETFTVQITHNGSFWLEEDICVELPKLKAVFICHLEEK